MFTDKQIALVAGVAMFAIRIRYSGCRPWEKYADEAIEWMDSKQDTRKRRVNDVNTGDAKKGPT